MQSKKAYPNYDESINFINPRDTQKWIGITTEIYSKVHAGMTKSQAVEEATSDLDKMEKIDFLNWLKFYEENSHNKYSFKKATAQNYYMSDDGIFLPTGPVASSEPKAAQDTHSAVDSAIGEDTNVKTIEEAKKRQIQDHKNKILSRLNAAERLVSSGLTKDLLGKEFSDVLQSLMNIKMQVLNTKIASCSNKTYQDLIVRQANMLHMRGLSKSSKMLLKIASTLPPPPEPPAPTNNVGLPGEMTTNPIPPTQISEMDALHAEDAGDIGAISEFMSNLEGGVVGTVMSDELSADTAEYDEGAVMGDFNKSSFEDPEDPDDDFEDESDANDDILFIEDSADDYDYNIIYEDEKPSLFVEAQDAAQAGNLASPPAVAEPSAPAATPAIPAPAKPIDGPKAPVAPAAPAEMTVSEDADDSAENFDSYIDKAFENLSVTDIVNKLNDLTKIFKTREIPRQLSTIDMMLDHLGLSTYFPSLAEATNKSLESNQYILSRIEDIASRLQGSLESKEIDLSQATKSPSADPEAMKVKNDLEQKSEKEKERKRLKKEIEEKALEESAEANEKPEIEVQEDMAGPVNTATDMPQAAPAQPATAPATSPVAKPA